MPEETTPCAKKIIGGLTVRCLGALSLGLIAVIGITAGLISIAGDNIASAPSTVAAYTLKFPEDEQALKDMSAQILKEADGSASAKKASEVEPAAGDKPTDGK